MSRLSQLATTLIGVAVLALSLWVAAPAQAEAVSCRGGSCTGKDPQAQGCTADAKTVREFTNVTLRVELRYSARCQALWARWTIKESMDHLDHVFIRRHNPNGSISQRMTNASGDAGNQGWTVMIGRRPKDRFDACNFVDQKCTKPLWPKRVRAAAAEETSTVSDAPVPTSAQLPVPTTTAAANSWNCRVVIADSVGFFAHSTGRDRSSPPTLGQGRRFKSFGVENGRYRAQLSDPAAGWVTADSRYVERVPDSWCVW